ncbi:MAG: YecA family protein [Sarcina sp.]
MNNYDINKQLGINKPIKHDLKSCLNDLTKDKIMGYMQSYGLKGVSKLKKAEIIDKFYDEFITNKKIELAMKGLNPKDLELIDRLVVEKEVDITNADVNDFITLNIAGLAFIYAQKESLKLVMPDENIKIVKMLNNKELHKEAKEANTLESYLNSFVELYGAFKVDFFVKAFNEYTGEKITEKDLVELFKENDNEIGFAYFKDGYIMNQEIAAYENELEKFIASKVIDQDFKMLDKEELLKYGTRDFIEMTVAHENLLALITKLTKDKEVALDILFELQVRFITEEYDMYEALGVIDKVVSLNKVKKNIINDMVKKTLAMYDNTRRWANNGFTNIELKEMNEAVEAPKVGRNEPCPCGSGKKYKKCCLNS